VVGSVLPGRKKALYAMHQPLNVFGSAPRFALGLGVSHKGMVLTGLVLSQGELFNNLKRFSPKTARNSALIGDSNDLHCTVEMEQERARPTFYAPFTELLPSSGMGQVSSIVGAMLGD